MPVPWIAGLVLSVLGPGDPPQPEVVAWLSRAAVPIPSLERGGAPEAMAALGRRAGSARIVALGEATHGSHEFFAFKARAIEHLVAELGFTDVALETGVVNAFDTDDWVANGRGSLASAMAGLADPWRVKEYAELLQWLRDWNSAAERHPVVHVHGIDPQIHAGEAAEALNAYLTRAAPELAPDLAPLLARLGRLEELDEADLAGLPALLDEERETLVAHSDAESWSRARATLGALLQRHRLTRLEGAEAMDFRDRCMAANAQALLDARPGARLVLSAHDGHVSRAGLFELPTGVVESVGRALAAGMRARGEPDTLLVVGAAFARGAFRAWPAAGGAARVFTLEAPRAGSLEGELEGRVPEMAWIDLSAAPADGPVRAWLDLPRPHLAPGGVWDPSWSTAEGQAKRTSLAHEYDALVFFALVTAAQPLE